MESSVGGRGIDRRLKQAGSEQGGFLPVELIEIFAAWRQGRDGSAGLDARLGIYYT